jgi:hypothetical protein
MDYLTNNWKEVLLAVITVIGGGSLAFKIFKGNKVNQNNNNVGGDMAGRDINK